MAEVAGRLGVTTHSLYAWIKKFDPNAAECQAKADEQDEIRRLKKELKRVTEERDVLKKPRRTSPITSSEVRLYPRALCRATGSAAVWFAGGAA
jgi:transposase-like protein